MYRMVDEGDDDGDGYSWLVSVHDLDNFRADQLGCWLLSDLHIWLWDGATNQQLDDNDP